MAKSMPMRPAPDWARFASTHWEQSSTRLRLGAPLIPPEQAFQGRVSVSAPFRFGTRFRARPDVRFFADTDRLRAPGTLLPGEQDADATTYLQRVGRELGAGRCFQCFVEQPLMQDSARWEREQLGRYDVPYFFRKADGGPLMMMDAPPTSAAFRPVEWGVRLSLEKDGRTGAVSFDWPETVKRLTFSWNRRTVRLTDEALDEAPAPQQGKRARRRPPTA